MAAPTSSKNEPIFVTFQGDIASKIVKLKVRNGHRVAVGSIIGFFDVVNGAKRQKIKSNEFGIVDKILIGEGEVINPGDKIVELKGCDHPVVMKDMCAECGADLRVECGFSGERKEQSSASVAMVHSIPELIVSEQQAVEIGKEDEVRLLETKKLVLLVDLDQTVLHTTNDPVPNNLKDVIHFQLWHGSRLMWYHTKFRPGTERFLERVSRMYELHICTFGARMYAHTMARHLDPCGKYFSHRILSRDECFNPMSKTANLRALFPCGDSMVCIIDDREDIWSYAPHLVHVKPYRFFKGTADINAPPGCDKSDDVSEEIHADDALHDKDAAAGATNDGSPALVTNDGAPTDNNADTTDGNPPSQTKNDTTDGVRKPEEENDEESMEVDSNETQTSETTSQSTTSSTNSNEYSKTQTPAEGKKESDNGDSKREEMVEWNDPDDYLLYLEDILTRIHTAYYDFYDEHIEKKTPTIPDLKNIIPYVKRKVLKGVNLVFSGVVPKNVPPEQCKAWQLAKTLGATVQDDFVRKGENGTTHVVAAKLGTAKVNQALRDKRAKLVTLDWLWCCAHRWEKVDERLFLLKEGNSRNYGIDSPVAKPKRKHDDTDAELSSTSEKRLKLNDSAGTSRENSNFQEEISPMLKFSKEDLDSMDKEVNDLMGSDLSSSESEDDDDSREGKILEEKLRKKVLTGEESDSSSADSLSADFPKGWKHENKKRLAWPVKGRDDDDESLSVASKSEDGDDTRRLLISVGRNSDSSDMGSEVDSIGSVDEEMAEAVEREFLN